MKSVYISRLNHFDSYRIAELLEQHKIEFFFKDSQESSLQSGWVDPGSSFNERMLFVDQSRQNGAQEIIQKYITDYSD